MVLLYLFAFVVLVNCFYFLLFSTFSLRKQRQEILENHFPISIVVYAKNKASNLREHIPLWLNQQYPDFEIILVNDASFDKSLEVMELFKKNNKTVQIVNVENNEAFWGSKKYALTLGKEVGGRFSTNKQIVLGFGSYQKKKGLLNKLVRFDALMTAVQYFSYALAGIPFMGVGKNLGYTSKVYYDNGGFVSHMDLQTGDDDLFINQVATKTNTAICDLKNSFTYSQQKLTWKEWILLKKKKVTTRRLYQLKHRILLGFYYVSQILFWTLSIITMSLFDWKIPLILILFRLLMQYLIVYPAAKKLNEKELIIWLPLMEILLIIFEFTIFINYKSSKSNSWN
jgi:glycosyltransferase involved in cell wall biosynthesis